MSFEQATQDQLHQYVTRFCDTVNSGLDFLEQSLGDYHAKIAYDQEEEETCVIFKYNKTRITKKTQLADFYKVSEKGLTSLEDGAMTLPFNDEDQKPEKLAAMMVACLASKQRIHVPVCQSCIEEQDQ